MVGELWRNWTVFCMCHKRTREKCLSIEIYHEIAGHAAILTTSLPLLDEMKSRGVFGQANEDRLGLCCVGGKHGTGTSCGDVVMTDLCEKIKTACDCMYGEGTFEKAQVEQTETDFAHCFRISLPGGTNFIIKAMKKDE